MNRLRRIVHQPRAAQHPRGRDRLTSLIKSIGSTRPPINPSESVATPASAMTRDVDTLEGAQRLYDRWTRFAGQLWITNHGDAARHEFVRHLQRHPHLLVTDPVWRDRLLEVIVARATQVLLPPEYDHSDPHDLRWWLADDVRDMLRGLTVLDGAQVPTAITPAFIAADELLERYLDARTYEETPLGFIDPERGMDEFPDSDESIDALNDLLAFLGQHPELAGTREFASWYDERPIGPQRIDTGRLGRPPVLG